MEPGEAVAETPVKPIDISVGVIEPTLEVADCPVNPTTSAGARAPTETVASCPVGDSVTASRIIPPTLDVAD